MKNNYKKMKPADLLTGIYTNTKFREDYFKWTRIGGYKNNKQLVNQVVIAYEYYLIEKLEGNWATNLLYKDIDLINYRNHDKHIKAFVKTLQQ